MSYTEKIANLHDDHTPATSNDNNTGGYYGHHPANDTMWSRDNVYGEIVTKYNKHLHSTYHEGSLAFTSDQKKMFFTANDPKSKKEDGIIKLKIVEAQLNKKGKYKDSKKLPFNSIHYSVCHPTIMKDDKAMIFASDMPGGIGGKDLWYSTYDKKTESWAKPINLGKGINTVGNELFPTFGKDGKLFTNRLYSIKNY
jgi:hypothetical protein